ncbi:MAG: ADP-ribosylglycohydrolase family protein [Chloroflexota bacterium]
MEGPITPEAAAVVARYPAASPPWPVAAPPPAESDSTRDRFRGSLLWGAVGDALGRPNEARSWETIHERWGPGGLTEFRPWRGWTSGPIGTWTDDTQLTIEVARTILESDGRVDPARLGERLRAWLPHGRGKGHATTQAVEILEAGRPWWEAGPAVDSAGNGAAMRAAPVGLVWAFAADTGMLVREAILSALPTHGHPVGVAGAVAIAAGTAACLRMAGRPMEPARLLRFVADAIADLEPGPTRLRSDPLEAATLRKRLLDVEGLLRHPPQRVFEELWTGAFALESVPAAFYCFLRAPEDPGVVIITAANAGHDTDTIASMAGNLAGAYLGSGALRDEHPSWWAELEGREELVGLADALFTLAMARSSAT